MATPGGCPGEVGDGGIGTAGYDSCISKLYRQKRFQVSGN